MRDEPRSSSSGRTVYRSGSGSGGQAARRGQATRTEDRRRADRVRRSAPPDRRKGRLGRRILFAVLVILLTVAVSFGIGYLIGLYIAVVPVG